MDIFGLLEDVSPVTNVDAEADTFWFEYDVSAIKRKPEESLQESWATKLSSVAAAMVINLIMLHHKYHGRKHFYNDDENCKDIIKRLPTPAWTNIDDPYPPFPIYERSLREWVAALEEGGNSNSEPPKIPTAADEWQSRINDINDGVSPGATESAITQKVQEGFQKDAEFHQTLLDDLAANEIDVSEYHDNDFANPSAFPTISLQPKQLTPFLEQFIDANIFGRAYLLIDDLRLQQTRLAMIVNNCNLRLEYLKQLGEKLTYELHHYQEFKQRTEALVKHLRGEDEDIHEMIAETEAAQRDKDFQQALTDNQRWGAPQSSLNFAAPHGGKSFHPNLVRSRSRASTPLEYVPQLSGAG